MATTNKGLNQPAYDSPNWDVPLNANFGFLDAALGSTTSISVAGVPATPVVLTDTQYRSASFVFSGLLGNNVTYQIPSGVGGTWSVFNNTTGAFTLTLDNVAVGTSVTIPQGQSRLIFSDGTNIKFPSNYGSSGQVLFNNASGTTGDAAFTYAASVLTAPRARLGDGTVSLPALSPTTSPDTGLWFPAVDEIGLATNGTERLRLNVNGALAVGASTSYGTTGQFLKTAGAGAPMSWGYAGTVTIASQVASGSSVTFSGLTLTPYKLLIVVISSVRHNAGGDRAITLDGVSLRPVYAGGNNIYGLTVIHLATGVGMAGLGNVSGGGSEVTGYGSGVQNGSTSVTMALSGTGSFVGGNFYLLGLA